MGEIMKLNKIAGLLAQAKLDIKNQPTETTDINDLKTMAELLSTEARLERQVAEIKRQTHNDKSWEARLIQASDIEPEGVKWLWPNWISLGKLTLLAGDGGSGKSTLALSFSAMLSSGSEWPDKTKYFKKANVVIWSGEDDAKDTLIPRLIAADADLDKILIIDGKIGPKNQVEAFDPARDLGELRVAISKLGGASLLVLDPIVSLIRGDMHKANDVRRCLEDLVAFAAEMDCAVIGITHFNKGRSGKSAVERVIGSQAFTALSRTTLVVGKQDDSELRVIARAKSNISIDHGGYSYRMEPCTVKTKSGLSIDTVRTVWGDFIEGSALQILSSVEGDNDDDGENDPTSMLRAILEGGRILSNVAKQTMEINGYTIRQTRRAREKLKVVISREGFSADIKSYWELPPKA